MCLSSKSRLILYFPNILKKTAFFVTSFIYQTLITLSNDSCAPSKGTFSQQFAEHKLTFGPNNYFNIIVHEAVRILPPSIRP